MPAAFSPAPDVREIAEELIPDYFSHLQDHGVRMVYLYRDDKPFKNGKAVFGTARKVSGLTAFLASGQMADSLADEIANQAEETLRPCDACKGKGEKDGKTCEVCVGTGQIADDEDDMAGAAPFFVITITSYFWQGLDEKKRRALVHHELCHCGARYDKDKNTLLFIVPHDLEEFREVVEVYGLWMPDVEKMGEAFKKHVPQLQLLTNEDLTPDIVVRTRGPESRDIVLTGEAIDKLAGAAS